MATERRERPIIFSGEMVRAILDGRKTMTRRVMRTQPSIEWAPYSYGEIHGYNQAGELDPGIVKGWGPCSGDGEEGYWCPYGKPGDLLWVRETWQAWDRGVGESQGDDDIHEGSIALAQGKTEIEHKATSTSRGPWRPSIHMPRWASRITLKVTGVRVERVQDINAADALAEGIEFTPNPGSLAHDDDRPTYPEDFEGYSERRKQDWFDMQARCTYMSRANDAERLLSAFQILWDTLNAKRGYSWDSNPWVWVVEFKQVEESA